MGLISNPRGKGVEAVIDEDLGQKAYFISRADLLLAKPAAGRLQDLADVEAIREADGA